MIEAYIALAITFTIAMLIASIGTFIFWRSEKNMSYASTKKDARNARRFLICLIGIPASWLWPLAAPTALFFGGRWLYWQLKADLVGLDK